MPDNQQVNFLRYADGEFSEANGNLPLEQAVTLIVNGKPWMEMICTPRLVRELVAGFLYNERLINSSAEISSILVCDSADFVEVVAPIDLKKPTSWVKTTGCSGGLTSQRLKFPQQPSLNELTITADALSDLLRTFLEEQNQLSTSRGMHCSAISEGQGLIAIADDIGRHNTLDKLMGQVLLHSPASKPALLITTGRISSEMLQKAGRIGASMVVSLTSPNLFTVQLADEWGMTIIGYARPDRFNIYTHPERFLK